MPILDIWEVLENPAWLFAGLTIAVALLGFAILMLYPFAKDN